MPAESLTYRVDWAGLGAGLGPPGRVVPDDPTPLAPSPAFPSPTPDVLRTPVPAVQNPAGQTPGGAIPTGQSTASTLQVPSPYPTDATPADSGGSWSWLWVVLLLLVAILALAAGWWLWRTKGAAGSFGLRPRLGQNNAPGTADRPRLRDDATLARRRPPRYPPGTKLVNPWGQPSLARLIDLGPQVRQQLADYPLILAWPSAAVLDRDGMLVATQFRQPQGLCEPGRNHPARLDTLIGPSALPGLDLPLRRDIATWIGHLIAAMHEQGWALGTFDWHSFHFCARPNPHLHVSGIERAREMGAEAAFALVADKHWADPRDGAILASFEQDRYRFALLVQRLLLVSDPAAALETGSRLRTRARAGANSPPTDSREHQSLRDLAQRASGQLHERPTLAEWLAILQRRVAKVAPADPHETEPGTLRPTIPQTLPWR